MDNKDMYISIIIPCYNVEGYIVATLDSIKNQSSDTYEVIIVDDGSTDNTAQVINRWLSENNTQNFHYFYKENGGLSDARNFGLTKANYDYVWFVDGDDCIADQSISLLSKVIMSSHPEIVGFNFCYDAKEYSYKNSQARIIEHDDLIDIYLCNGKECEESACNKIFNKNLFSSIKFKLGKIHGDTSISYRLLEQATKYMYLDEDLYNVISRQGSITRSEYSERHYDKVEACYEIYQFYKDSLHCKNAFNKYFGTLLYFYLKINKNHSELSKSCLMQLNAECSSNAKYLAVRFIPFYLLIKLNLIQFIHF